MRRKEAYRRQLDHPEPSSAQTVSPHHRRHAQTHQVSDPSPHRGAPRRTSPSEAQAEAGRTALGDLLGDRASAEGGCGEPARGAKHEQGLEAAPVLSDLLGPQPCAQRWALPLGLRPAPKGDFATGQHECNGRANRREMPLLERPAHAVCAQRCWMFATQRFRSVTARTRRTATAEKPSLADFCHAEQQD